MKTIIAIIGLLLVSSAAQAHHHRHHRYHVAVSCVATLFTPCPAPAEVRLGRRGRVLTSGQAYTPGEGSQNTVRARSGARATVAVSAQGAFQCVIDALERVGYPVRFLGGLSVGHMRHSLHHVGLALDINQVRRNITTPHMPSNEIALANGCGLISGAQWRNGDSGHFQVGGWAGGPTRHHRRRRR